ncbi:hypothetical protein SAMN03159318_04706 [Pseudomonas sp. NFACC42-2]|nr:hypothetical protein SAMN03159318_04706 [Pseudomonas sp. NFACC42-2]
MSLLYAGPNVGGAVRRFDLPPMRVCQPQMYKLTHRYRGQVESSHRPSHIWTALGQEDVL